MFIDFGDFFPGIRGHTLNILAIYRNRQCAQNTPFSGMPGSGNSGGLGESCANGCSGDLNCCGIFPFRRCWPCCNDSHCDWQNGEECKKRFCI